MSLSTKQIKDQWERLFWNKEKDKFPEYVDAYKRSLREFGLTGNEFTGGKILEIGAGPFSGFLPLLKAAKKVSVDSNNDMYKDDGILVAFKDIEYISDEFENYGEQEFDAIFCKNALDHGDMDFSTILKIAKALKKGGKFFLIVNLRLESELNACHDHLMTMDDFRKYTDESGLIIIKEDIWETDKIHGDVYRTLCAVLQK